MSRSHKIVVVSTLFVLLFVILASQLYAQTPTAIPPTATPIATATTTSVTPTPSQVTTLTTRQAVVKRPIDGDSVEVVFTDDGTIATVHLANVDAPESVGVAECFGRESAEFAVQAYQNNPLISVVLVGEVQNGEASGYVKLADGALLNNTMVLFGYARYDDQIENEFASQIKEAEGQGKQGRIGLWRNCGETETPPKPCFIFSQDGLDSATKREVLDEYPSQEISTSFLHAYYDSVQNEIVVTWKLYLNSSSSGERVREYFQLPDCLRDRSEVYQRK